MADFVKGPDLEFVAQLKTFAHSLPTYADVLRIAPDEMEAVRRDAEAMAAAVNAVTLSKSYAQGWTALKNLARRGGKPALPPFPTPVDTRTSPAAMLSSASPVTPGIEERFRALARRIKAHPAYTVGMGEDLGIHADEDTTELTAPVLTVKLDGRNPVISFKKGKSDGIRLYGRRGSETAFTFLAVDTRSPYVDNRPNQTEGVPEKREYYAFFMVSDQEVGAKSATIEITL
jgi:hypothetical protein